MNTQHLKLTFINIQHWQTAFIGAVFVAFLDAMLFSEGRADMNAYNEGWLETAIAGILFIAGLKK